jgi:hypothetical protein
MSRPLGSDVQPDLQVVQEPGDLLVVGAIHAGTWHNM